MLPHSRKLALAVVALAALGAAPPSTAADAGVIAFERRCGTGCADLFAVRPDGTGLRRLTTTRNSFDPAFSPDGTRIVFASDRAGGSGAPELYVMDTEGANVERLTRTIHAPSNFRASFAPAWSPDGGRIAFVRLAVRGNRSSEELYVMNADGTRQRRLTYTPAREADPAWSPDGTRIAFARDGGLYVLALGGGPAARLAPLGAAPAWSPDGTRIAFTGAQGGIHVVNADGSGVRRLTRAGGAPSWSDDGSRIAYQGDHGIFVVEADGGSPHRLTRPPALRNDESPAWQPAQRAAARARGEPATIAFASNRDGDTELYLARLDGTGLVRLTRNRAADYYPAWSPDGTRLAFVSDRDGDDDVYVMNANGTGLRRLTRDRAGAPANDTAPTWAPDGRRIAFASNRDGGEHEIYVVNADGSGVRRLTRTARHVIDHTPSWSPDGRRIAFASNRDSFFNLEIYVMNADGSGVTRLTRTKGSDTVLGDDATPSWSPDGTRIAFASNRDQNNEIYVMNAGGSGQRRLTRSPSSDDMRPGWSPDGTLLVFATQPRGGRERVQLVRADGTGLRRLLLGSDPAWRPCRLGLRCYSEK